MSLHCRWFEVLIFSPLFYFFCSKDHWELTITREPRSSGPFREEAGSHWNPSSATAHPIHWLVRSPHEDLHLQGSRRLCCLYHVFPLPVSAELHISPHRALQPHKSLWGGVWAPCSSPSSWAGFAKCSHAILQEGCPRYTPCLFSLWANTFIPNLTSPQRCSIAVLPPETTE